MNVINAEKRLLAVSFLMVGVLGVIRANPIGGDMFVKIVK